MFVEGGHDGASAAYIDFVFRDSVKGEKMGSPKTKYKKVSAG